MRTILLIINFYERGYNHIMKKRFKLYLTQDNRNPTQPNLIEHFIGHIWLPRSSSKRFIRKVKLPCLMSNKWIKESVFLNAISINDKDKILYVETVGL